MLLDFSGVIELWSLGTGLWRGVAYLLLGLMLYRSRSPAVRALAWLAFATSARRFFWMAALYVNMGNTALWIVSTIELIAITIVVWRIWKVGRPT